MLIRAFAIAFLFQTVISAHAENLNPSAAKSLEFKEEPKPKASRGPASVEAAVEIPAFQELADDETEAGFCLFCGSGGATRARTLVEQGHDILKHAQRSNTGK